MEGEEAKTEGEEYPHVLVTKALSSRNLTQEEEQLLEDQKVCEEHDPYSGFCFFLRSSPDSAQKNDSDWQP